MKGSKLLHLLIQIFPHNRHPSSNAKGFGGNANDGTKLVPFAILKIPTHSPSTTQREEFSYEMSAPFDKQQADFVA
ncbi:MAG: hypothetical protein EAZ13_04705 [Sphingobacteriia bacterium]|nr:MAG: hypothetical protein EAZ13_04705 [Sphingobacteriia bacterium]